MQSRKWGSSLKAAGLVLTVLGLAACASGRAWPNDEWQERYDRQPEEVQAQIQEGKVYIGMSKEQVLLSWSRPDDINRTVTQTGTHEQWVYERRYQGELYATQYLYFDDDELTAMQD